MKVGQNITPLMKIPLKVTLNYASATRQKRPIVHSIDGLVVATPTIRLNMINNVDSVTPGNVLEFNMSILLTKMRCPLQIEVSVLILQIQCDAKKVL